MRALAIVVLLTACGGKSSKSKQPEPEDTAPREATPEPERTGVAECDAAIARMECLPDDHRLKGKPETMQDLKQSLKDPDKREAMIELCKIVLETGYQEFSAQGCWTMGDELDAYVPPEPDNAPRDYTFVSTGNAVCDELIAKTMCMYEKTPGVPREALDAFREGSQMWTEYLRNAATRQATIDACQMSLDGGKAGFEALGCQ